MHLIAHEQSKLIIGKVYSVAHAVIERLNGNVHQKPVNPFKHKDPQFGTDFYHYHIDGRFGMDAWCKGAFLIKDGITNIPVHCDPSHIGFDIRYTVKEIIYLNKRCVRLTTGTNPPLKTFLSSKQPSKYAIWYNTMIGKSCAGKKCPHFGTVMIEQNGVLVCPLHNLKGDIKSEKIIPAI